MNITTMKNLIAIGLLLVTVFAAKAQVKFARTLNYQTTPANSWEGIDVDFDVDINGSASQGGVSFGFNVRQVTINRVKIRTRWINASQIPSDVLSKLKNDIRIGSIEFNLFVYDFNVKKMETKSTIGWAELQRLDNAEGYKQSVRENGYKLFNNGALAIRNPVVKTVNYMIDQAYRDAIEKEITGAGRPKTTTNGSSKSGEVKNLKLTVSSSSSTSSSSSNASSGSAEGESSSESKASENMTIHNNRFALEAYKKQQQEKLIADGAKLMGDFFDSWQANREKRWAREKLEDERFGEKVASDKRAYDNFITSQEDKLFKNAGNYFGMLQSMMPKVLVGKKMTWEDILGSPDHDQAFGKDIKVVGRKLKAILPKDRVKNKLEPVAAEDLPKQFTLQDFYTVNTNQTFFYWVNRDFYEHAPTYIVDSRDVLVGIKIDLHTSSREQQAFPSSLQEYVSLKSYYDGILKGTGGNYFFADGKTLVTRDKVYILDFKSLVVYDLNYFDPKTRYNVPPAFSQSAAAQALDRLGFRCEGFRENETKKHASVRVTEVDKNSAGEKSGLLPGDVVLAINDITIDFPFHLQWYFLAFPQEKNFNVKIERAKKIATLSIKL